MTRQAPCPRSTTGALVSLDPQGRCAGEWCEPVDWEGCPYGEGAPYDQPPPLEGHGDVTADVIRDLQERSQIGTRRYGTPLQYRNGRDPLMDAYQEALDLCCYLRQAIGERTP